jgi:hypothetical protein
MECAAIVIGVPSLGRGSITGIFRAGERAIVRNEAGNKGDLKAGAPFRIQAAAKQADGTYTTSSISVGKDGGRPF